MPGLKQRLDRLQQRLPPPPKAEDEAVTKSRTAVWARFGKLIRSIEPLTSEDEDERILNGLREWLDDNRGPYCDWTWGLRMGWSRLPKLRPEAMKELLLTCLSPDCDSPARVCKNCGLAVPRHKPPHFSQWKLLPGKRPFEGPPPWYDLPSFFPICPHCDASEVDRVWGQDVPDGDFPWKALDGYVTIPPPKPRGRG